MATGETSIISLVEAFLQAEKTLEGIWRWSWETRGRVRCIRPIAINGEIGDGSLEIHFYPREKPPKFRISLILQRRVWGLDFDDDRKHTNSLNRASDAPATVFGPHYHSWDDNKRFATKVSLPKEFKNARELPKNVRHYEQALRWFCTQTRILIRNEDIIEPPKPDTLL